MTFVIDTSSFRVLRNYYPEQFPTFWEFFDAEVEERSVTSTREVRRELEDQLTEKEGWLLDWVKAHPELFPVPSAAETVEVATILEIPHFQQLVGEKQRLKGKPVADPFVIARAIALDGTVVTEESKPDNGARIPNVCERLEVPCINLKEFLEQMDWSS